MVYGSVVRLVRKRLIGDTCKIADAGYGRSRMDFSPPLRRSAAGGACTPHRSTVSRITCDRRNGGCAVTEWSPLLSGSGSSARFIHCAGAARRRVSSAALSPEVRKAEQALRARAWAASRERLGQLRLTGAIGDPAFQLLEAELDRFELDTEVRSRW